MNAKRVTGAEVAAAAGVSPATVSYVLNDTPGQTIPEDTRNRVLAAAARLGYAPQMAGRALRTGRSDLIAWILPDWPIGAQIGRIIEGLTREASRRRFTLTIIQETSDVARLEATIRTLSPAALIAIHALPNTVVTYAKRAGIPIASTHQLMVDADNSDAVQSAHAVGYAQVQYLAGKGHRTIAFLAPNDPRVDVFTVNRLAGARAAAKELGLPALQRRTVPLERARLATVAERWQRDGVTAVCCYNDEWAIGLLSGMDAANLRAPQDLAVIGCDDIPTAAVASPPLTTIAQGVEPLCRMLLAQVELGLGMARTEPIPAVQPTAVVERESA